MARSWTKHPTEHRHPSSDCSIESSRSPIRFTLAPKQPACSACRSIVFTCAHVIPRGHEVKEMKELTFQKNAVSLYLIFLHTNKQRIGSSLIHRLVFVTISWALPVLATRAKHPALWVYPPGPIGDPLLDLTSMVLS